MVKFVGDDDIDVASSADGGLNTTDSTRRIVLHSHQKAQRLAQDGTTPAHFGEVIRMDLEHAQAKCAIAFRENYINPGTRRTVAWLVAHGASNDDPDLWHNHLSVELPDENGNMQTVFEWPFAPWDVEDGYGHAVSGHYSRSTQQLIASNRGLVVEGTAGTDRNLHFSTGARGADANRRWSIQADTTAESGSNAGSNFRISRRTDGGVFTATALFIRRSDGQVGIGNTAPTSALDVTGTTRTDGLIIDAVSSDPGSPTTGQIWYNSTADIFKVRQSATTMPVDSIESFTFSVADIVSVATGKLRMYLETSYVFVSARASVDTQPTGASLIVDINKNGSTIYSTQGNRPTIAVSTNTATGNSPNTTTFASGDYITVDVDQVGSTVAGSDLTVTIRLRRS